MKKIFFALLVFALLLSTALSVGAENSCDHSGFVEVTDCTPNYHTFFCVTCEKTVTDVHNWVDEVCAVCGLDEQIHVFLDSVCVSCGVRDDGCINSTGKHLWTLPDSQYHESNQYIAHLCSFCLNARYVDVSEYNIFGEFEGMAAKCGDFTLRLSQLDETYHVVSCVKCGFAVDQKHILRDGACLVCLARSESFYDCDLMGHSWESDYCHYCGYVCSHDYGGWKIIKSPTCSQAGMKKRTCMICLFENYQSTETTPHSWVNGECWVCGVSSEGLCSHQLSDWIDDPNNTDVCGDEAWIYRYCIYCNMTEQKSGIVQHNFVNFVCTKCGAYDDGHRHYAQRAVILGDVSHQNVCSCGFAFSVEGHIYNCDYVLASGSSHEPMKKKLTCEVCEYERVYFVINPDLRTLKLSNGQRIKYSELISYDCLYYEYDSVSSGMCQIGLLTDDGQLYKQLSLPSLKRGEKILIDTQTGYYSIWDDVVNTHKTVIDATMLRNNNGKYDFTPNVESLPSPLDRSNAYFVTEYQGRYNYPVVDYDLRWQSVDYLYPYCVNVTGNVIQLRSFPQSTLAELISDIENYPLTFVLYDYEAQTYTAVTSTSDAFVAAYQRIKPSGGSNSGNTGDMGGSYAQGYADAYNTLTNSVIADNPIQGFMQGMWYGVLAMVTILGNGISIGGISLFSVLVSVVMVVVVYFVFKILRK